MSDLYDEDILLWSEHQAALLRRLAAGEPMNERPDWANIIEEVESVGREQSARGRVAAAAGSRLHMLKAEAWPLSRDCRELAVRGVSCTRRLFRALDRADASAPLPSDEDGPQSMLCDDAGFMLTAIMGESTSLWRVAWTAMPPPARCRQPCAVSLDPHCVCRLADGARRQFAVSLNVLVGSTQVKSCWWRTRAAATSRGSSWRQGLAGCT